jgi:predicted dehydrogenase
MKSGNSDIIHQEVIMIKFAIIGMGIRGRMYAKTLEQNQYAKLVGVCDMNAANLSGFGGEIESNTDYRTLIDRCRPDAVIIATPDFFHVDPFMYAVQAGHHVLVEKPLAMSLAEAEAMAAAVERAKTMCLVAFENRWNPPFVAVKREIMDGKLGEVSSVHFTLNDTIFVPTRMLPWAGKSSPGWFLFPHAVDMVSWLTGGDVSTVYAWGTKKVLKARGIDTYDSMKAMLGFSSGFCGSFSSSWILPESLPLVYDLKIEIIGTKNAYYIDLQNQMVRSFGETASNVHTLGYPVGGRMLGAPSLMLNDFIDGIRNDVPPESDVRAGLKNARIIAKVHESAATGSVIRVEA